MNSFTIKDIELLTGIKAHTIRIWEQRYKLLRPKRKDTNHRVYDNDDLKHIMRVSYLYHRGVKISKIAEMTDEEIRRRSLEEKLEEDLFQPLSNQLVEAMIDFDQQRFEKVFNNALLRFGFEKTILQVIYPFLQRVGLLWLNDCVNPAQEHFASLIVRKKMMVAIDGLELSRESGTDSFLLFLPEGEYHEIPLLFVQYLLKQHGCQVVNLGASVPLEDLKFFTDRRRVTHIYTHMLTCFSQKDMDAFLHEMADMFPAVQIIVSGPQTERIAHTLPANVRALHSLDEIIEFTRKSKKAAVR
ncbi:MerR family transcriptional regulator [Chitinophaga sedimenti]|uniref:MerR family transcriptional regulator n=1 Tax=Chitinophaga sedimenti TaxID=2033606 RepID=UPI002002F551|nr:MerR family transcriptional regulator [Chitinophaga sedimenti]MCK7556692.1 MerR family transcriptional regulator [Chitinophaga sedimenti]